MLKSQLPISLNNCTREAIFNYFDNTWSLEDLLIKSIIGEDTFYLNPDPLRNPLIFYLGHSAVFYINKLILVNLLEKQLNPDYEILFGVGVDPQSPEELQEAISHLEWPELDAAWDYRQQAYRAIAELIKNIPLHFPIRQQDPLWALMMGIEHQRIHFETSSMLIRQLPVDKVQRPEHWEYAPIHNKIGDNKAIAIAGGTVTIGKPENSPLYGWDSDYGQSQVNVKPFTANKYMTTNGEFLEFVKAGGYENQDYWDEESWTWKTHHNLKHPKFWVTDNSSYQYRAMFDRIELPLDWPVEVNHYEAMAYCRWQGNGARLMSEAEWYLATNQTAENQLEPNNFNLNLKYGSPSPVGSVATAESPSGLWDLRGNVWEWLQDDFYPLPGFKPHFLYEDNSALFFNNQHKMMRGGAWVTTGAEAFNDYRNWFRPNFYQHAGFRVVQD